MARLGMDYNLDQSMMLPKFFISFSFYVCRNKFSLIANQVKIQNHLSQARKLQSGFCTNAKEKKEG